jgi:hypothetical protein
MATNQSGADAYAAAVARLADAAEKLVYRPAVDDSRQIDRDTADLREALKAFRAASSPNGGVK